MIVESTAVVIIAALSQRPTTRKDLQPKTAKWQCLAPTNMRRKNPYLF